VTFRHPQMEPQRKMIEDLGVDGMSSDEEEVINGQKRYLIIPPQWRDSFIGPWLRVFDGLCMYHRLESDATDGRGRRPRDRVATNRLGASRKFVAGLPINAYRKSWLDKQLDVKNVVHPGPAQVYSHDPALAVWVAYHLIVLTTPNV